MIPVLALDHGVIPYIARCQDNGLPIDRAGCRALADQMTGEMHELLEALETKLGYYLNPNSDDQVRGLLRELLPAEDLANLKLTDGGEISTGKKVIEALRGLHPPIDDVIAYRQRSKIKTTYALPLATEIDPPPPAVPERARCNLRVTRVASGRLSASKRDDGGAATLTIPVRTELGRLVRKQYRVPLALRHRFGRRLMTRDLSQIEFRVVAHLSGDPTMCQIFHDGLDLHEKTASVIFGKPIHALDKLNERAPAKNAGFGILFGITAEGLMDQMRMMGVGHLWSVDRCQQLLDEWFKVYPGVRTYISRVRQRAAKQGYVSCLSGRRRYLPGAGSALSWVREEAWRQAVSLEVQGTAQDIIKTAMIAIWDMLRAYWRTTPGVYVEPLLQVHDELLFESDAAALPWLEAIVSAAMTTTTTLRVPILSSGGVGDDWGSLEK